MAFMRSSPRRSRGTTTSSASTAGRSPTPLALAARRPPRPLADRRRRPRRDSFAPRRLRELVIYELHVGTFTPEGTFDAVDPAPSRAHGARHHRDRDHAGGRVPRPPRLGLRRRLHLGRAFLLRGPGRTGPPRRSRARGGPRGDPRRRLQPRRRLGRDGAGGVRTVLHRQVRDAVGPGHELRRRRLRPGARMGPAERRRLGPGLRDRRPAPRRDPRHLRLEPGAHRGRRGPSRPRDSRGRAGDRRERAQRSQGDARPRSRAATAATARGRTTSTIRCARSSPTSARATTRSSAPCRQLAKALHRPHVHDGNVLELPPAAVRGAGRRRAARALRRLLAGPRPGRQPRLRRPDACAGAPAGRVLHAALAVRAAAVHGRGVRREGAVSVLHRPHRRGDRRRHARGPPPGVRRVRLVRAGDPRPAGPGDVRALEAPAHAGRVAGRAVRAPARGPPASCRPATPTRSSSTRTPAGCGCAGARSS